MRSDKLELNILSTTAACVANLSCACVQQPGGTENASTYMHHSHPGHVHAFMQSCIHPCSRAYLRVINDIEGQLS
jgi:hypothetical protein